MTKNDPEREGRLAAELRANLRRRKADAAPVPPPAVGAGLDADELAGGTDGAPPEGVHVPGRDDGDALPNPVPLLPPD